MLTFRIRKEETNALFAFSFLVSCMFVLIVHSVTEPPNSSDWLGLLIQASISLSRETTWEMVLPRYLKVSSFASWVPAMMIAGTGDGDS